MVLKWGWDNFGLVLDAIWTVWDEFGTTLGCPRK